MNLSTIRSLHETITGKTNCALEFEVYPDGTVYVSLGSHRAFGKSEDQAIDALAKALGKALEERVQHWELEKKRLSEKIESVKKAVPT